jgi:hypothetical protein
MSDQHTKVFKTGAEWREVLPLPVGAWDGLQGAMQIRSEDGRRLLANIPVTPAVNEDGTASLTAVLAGSATAGWAPGTYKYDWKVWTYTWGPHFSEPSVRLVVERPPTQV